MIVYLLLPLSVSANTIQSNILILYSLKNEEQLKEVRILETLVGEFSDQVKVIKDDDFNESTIQNYSHVFYFGGVKKELPQKLLQGVQQYKNPLFFMGDNAEQVEERLSFLKVNEEELINKIERIKNGKIERLDSNRIVNEIGVGSTTTNLLEGYREDGGSLPLLVKNNDDFYFSGKTLYDPFGMEIAEACTSFFNSTKKEKVRYLRLEDIHPKTNADQLQKEAEYLKEKNIPYMAAVIPVYFDGKKTIHLSDSPQLVKTLRYMQNNNASIIMHGYKHQYRQRETGEGFEFWDVENNRPIYQARDEKVKLEKDFLSTKEFEDYVAQGERFEKGYIENALTKGVQELTAHKLYPLAFEAPHYAILQQGYKIVSTHFSSYSGDLQLTDDDWEATYAPSFKTKPSFLHGMTLYPETLG